MGFGPYGAYLEYLTKTLSIRPLQIDVGPLTVLNTRKPRFLRIRAFFFLPISTFEESVEKEVATPFLESVTEYLSRPLPIIFETTLENPMYSLIRFFYSQSRSYLRRS